MTAILNWVIIMLDYKAIGRRIAFYRKKVPLTQSNLAEKLGITESYISQVERGSAKVSLSRLYDISEILHIDIALLVSDRAVFSDTPKNSEVSEIIKDWPEDRTSLLAEILLCLNDRIGNPKNNEASRL